MIRWPWKKRRTIVWSNPDVRIAPGPPNPDVTLFAPTWTHEQRVAELERLRARMAEEDAS